MEQKKLFAYKEVWNDIFKFLDINDYFSLELSNRTIKDQLMTYYQIKTKNLPNNLNLKNVNYKKLFLSKYMNSFVIFNVQKEFDGFEDVNITNLKSNTDNNLNSEKKKEKENQTMNQNYPEMSTLIENSHTNHSSVENSLFNQENNIQQIIVHEDKIFVLYHNCELKIFSMDLHGNFSFEMKFNFSYPKIQKFVFISEKSSLILIDTQGKIYSFYYPSIHDLIELNNNEVYLTLSHISDINMSVSDIYAIKDFLILLDEKSNFFYIHVNSLGLNFNKQELIRGNSKENLGMENLNLNLNVNVNNENEAKIVHNNNEFLANNTNIIRIFAVERNYNNIIKITSAENNIMFADDSHKIYYINSYDLFKTITVTNMESVTTFTPRVLNDFSCKLLQDLACGDSHWLVLEREDMKPLDKWNENEVQEWFKLMKLDEFLNIIKYEKINGKDILNGDETFFVNIMGMEDDQIKKVKYEINRVKNVSCKRTKLWGWGSNKQGQLGQINYNNTYVKSPTQINLPEMRDLDDYIVRVFCGKTFSLLLTKFGEIFITGNYNAKEKGNIITQQQQQEKSNNNSNNTGNNRDNSGKKNKTVDKHKPKPVDPNTCNRWVNITKEVCFDPLSGSDQEYFFRGKEVFVLNMKVFLFGYKSKHIPFTLQAKKPKLKHLKKGDKFPTSDAIVDLILNKKKNLADKFIIVYDDALLKFLETPVPEFLKSEVPYHKILQIKFFNNIIWDRKKRYHNLNFE